MKDWDEFLASTLMVVIYLCINGMFSSVLDIYYAMMQGAGIVGYLLAAIPNIMDVTTPSEVLSIISGNYE